MFHRFGLFASRRHRAVLWLSLLGFLGLSVLGTQAFPALKDGGQNDPAAASSRAEATQAAHFGGDHGVIIMVTARHGTVDSPAVAAVGRAVTTTAEHSRLLRDVTSYFGHPSESLESRDHRSALVIASLSSGTKPDALDSILTKVAGEGGRVALVQSGGSSASDTFLSDQVGQDLRLISIVAVPITVVLLAFVFGGLLAALIPLAISFIAIMGTLATLKVVTLFTSVSTYSIDLTIALGLGLAIDYSLLLMKRYREEVARGRDSEEAIAQAMATAGRTVLFSATTVGLSLTALLVFPLYFLRSFGYAGIAVVVFSVLGALIVLPAMLAGLGSRVAVPRWGRAQPAASGVPDLGRAAESPFWRRLTTTVTARPWLTAVPVLVVLLYLGSPLLHVHFASPDDRVLRAGTQPHQVGDALRTRFSTNGNNDLIAVARPTVLTPQSTTPSADQITAWRRYSTTLSTLPNVTSVTGPSGTYRHGRPVGRSASPPAGTYTDGIALWTIANRLDPTSSAAAHLVGAIRAVPDPTQATLRVGGSAADLVDQKRSIDANLIWAVVILVVASYLTLFLFTGSLLVPLKALGLNAITLFTVLGAMIWSFQDGHLSGLLGFTPTATSITIPPLVAVLAFALSMDYEVFLISRIKELHDQGVPNREAIIEGTAKTGRIVSTAAALLAVTFIAFCLSKISFLQFFGLGTGVAIVLDATIIRGVLVPAVMALIGEQIWWSPAPLRRLHTRFALQESAVHTPTPSTT